MKLGVFAVLFQNKPFEEALDYIASRGLKAIEIGTGGYPGDAHCQPERPLANEDKFNKSVSFFNQILIKERIGEVWWT